MSEDEITKFESKWREIYTEGIEKVFKIAENKSKRYNNMNNSEIETKTGQNFDLKQFTRIYTMAYDICTSKYNTILTKCYDRLCETIKNYCVRASEKIRFNRSYDILLEFVESFLNFEEIILKWILKFFSYLTRSSMKLRSNRNLEFDLRQIFKLHVYDNINQNLIDSFLNYLDRERNGEMIDLSILRNFVKFLLSIEINFMDNLYSIEIENKIIENTIGHYNKVVQDNINNPESNFVSYVNWGVDTIHKEELTLSNFLPDSTIKKILTNLKDIVFYQKGKILLESSQGFKTQLHNHNQEILKTAYENFSQERICFSLMQNIFKIFIKEELKNLITKYESLLNLNDGPREVINKTNYVEDFVIFYESITKIITNAFSNQNLFHVALKEVIEQIQSAHATLNNSYILPFYLDKNLKRSMNSSSTEAYRIIDNVMSIFPSLAEKDIFIDIHRNLLSNRIITEDYVSLDIEKSLINKLKLICGVEYTANVEGIICDLYVNRDLNEKYKMWMKEQKHKNSDSILSTNLETNYLILNHECWPLLNTNPVILPKELNDTLENFKTYYRNIWPKKILKWSFQCSIVEIDAKYKHKTYNLLVNTLQALILVSFNQNKQTEASFKDILGWTGISSEKELRNNLTPFFSFKILIKESENRIKLNEKFMSNSRRIKMITLPKSEEIIKKEKIEEDRSYAIEACIIRIMKSEKRISHNDLVQKILNQMDNFIIQIQTIKKKIDNLIDRDLMKRDPEDCGFYLYATS